MSPTPDDDLLHVNGVNGTTGDYLLEPLSPRQVVDLACDDDARGLHRAELRRRAERDQRGDLALAPGLDARDLAQTGWGVVFAADADEAVADALRPLLDLRRRQATAGGRERFYREFRGGDGHLPGESKQDFLARHGVTVGVPADPEYMPYYLLLVGDPGRVPFRFQYELDVEYAVGRLHFRTPDEYAHYARSVVAAETGPPPTPRQAVFFGARSAGDRATELSAGRLVGPLAESLRAAFPTWHVEDVVGEEAKKDRLFRLLGAEPPALLFTASHGMGFDRGDVRQFAHQGALLCSDWPGPSRRGRIPEAFYFAADDVAPDARLLGTMAFFFACYGAGTPLLDDFPHEKRLRTQAQIAPRPFVAALPSRLLTHPGGGALAVVGHVERAWTYSFLLGDGRPQLQVFRAALKQLLEGYPVGAALEWFNQRYAALAASLTGALTKAQLGIPLSPAELLGTASLWTGHNDARSYIILGDPAVRLRVRDAGGPRVVLTPLAEKVTVMPATPALPLNEEAMRAAEARYKKIEASRAGSFESTGGSEGLLRENPPNAVAKRLKRIGLAPEVVAKVAESLAAGSFEVAGAEAAEDAVGLERIIGKNMLLGVQYLDGGQAASRAVGRVVVRNAQGNTLGFGTGFLVSPRLLVTNNHVLDSADRARACVVEFNFQAGLDGRARTPVRFALEPETFFVTSPAKELDFAVVAVAEQAEAGEQLAEFGFNPLGALEDEILAGESVTIIQHPNGEPKQIALRENLVLKFPEAGDQFLHYQTDTTPGSSGSPVYNDQWEVVALHHSGFARRDGQGNILTPDGKIWKPVMGENKIDWIANEGVRVAAIVAFLRKLTDLTPERKQLLAAVLSATDGASPVEMTPARLGNGRQGKTPPAVPAMSAAPAAEVPTLAPGGKAVWTIPLRVEVTIGAPRLGDE